MQYKNLTPGKDYLLWEKDEAGNWVKRKVRVTRKTQSLDYNNRASRSFDGRVFAEDGEFVRQVENHNADDLTGEWETTLAEIEREARLKAEAAAEKARVLALHDRVVETLQAHSIPVKLRDDRYGNWGSIEAADRSDEGREAFLRAILRAFEEEV